MVYLITLRWRHNGHDGVSNHQPHDCLLKRLFRRRSKKTSKLRVTGLCEGNSPVTGEFPAQRASQNAENASIWWRHHELSSYEPGPRVCMYVHPITPRSACRGILVRNNRRVSQMRAPIAACHETAGSYNRLLDVLYILNIKRNIF